MRLKLSLIKSYLLPLIVISGIAAIIAVIIIWFNNEAVIKQIKIEGSINPEQEKQALSVLEEHVTNTSFTSLSLGNLAQHIEQIPWVDTVSLRRNWPDTLVVEMAAHKPIARWNESGFISADGSIFEQTTASTLYLPHLFAQQGQEKRAMHFYLQAMEVLNPYQLKLEALHLTAAGTWKLLLSTGLVVHVDNHQPEVKVQKFIETLNRDLKTRQSQIAVADLRYPHGFAIQWKINTSS